MGHGIRKEQLPKFVLSTPPLLGYRPGHRSLRLRDLVFPETDHLGGPAPRPETPPPQEAVSPEEGSPAEQTAAPRSRQVGRLVRFGNWVPGMYLLHMMRDDTCQGCICYTCVCVLCWQQVLPLSAKLWYYALHSS